MDGEQKTSDRKSCKRQLALTLEVEKRLWRTVRSQQNQAFSEINTRLNDGARRRVSKWTVPLSFHRMGFGSRRPTRVPLLNARHQAVRLAWGREQRNLSEIYILSSRHPLQKIRFEKGRMLKMVIVYEVLLFSVQIIPHPPLYPKFKERFITKLPFNFSLDVKSMKISSSEVESPSGVS
ncbi:HTH_Tnp_Tc3_2 domain-containing protein [Trichonephila clavipes]|nr:HTH_Tnp_Tc3_2 domain-containing protein [Trichonephila clavipes]